MLRLRFFLLCAPPLSVDDATLAIIDCPLCPFRLFFWGFSRTCTTTFCVGAPSSPSSATAKRSPLALAKSAADIFCRQEMERQRGVVPLGLREGQNASS